jgi:hypothetical protein
MRFIILLVLTTGLFPKSREVNLDDELRNALFKGLVKVEDYRHSTILFRPVDNLDILMTATTGDTEPRLEEKAIPSRKMLTGRWASIGDQVLIVIDQNGKVSLFAFDNGEDYRFWNPYNMFDGTLFRFTPPARKLDDKQFDAKTENESLDGCLLKKVLISHYDQK